MDLGTALAVETIKRVFSVLDKRKLSSTSPRQDIEGHVAGHLTEVRKWSERVQFLGMSQAQQTARSTVAISLDLVPRKFKGDNSRSRRVSELALLQDNEHYVLLGDPGSGKTTTLKRLARHLLLKPSVTEELQYPLIVILRSLSRDKTLEEALADIYGLRYSREAQPANSSSALDFYCGEERLQDVLVEILSSTRALILLDGLDEIAPERRESLEKSAAALAHRITEAKIIMSCRSGDYSRQIEGFNVVELCPLKARQISSIASKWLPDAKAFMARWEKLPFRDLASRPLFFCQLIVLYRNSGYLPGQPSAVYKRILRLLLEEWDEQRGIQRRSEYADFDADRKIEFLSALSYHLTYRLKTKSFSTQQLIAAYEKIYQLFGLPAKAAKQVAREIETHTGIVVEAGYDIYEFSHLSLQEYLCANYLVREPFADRFFEYLAEYPAPLAVAVSLSANPSRWLAALLLRRVRPMQLTDINLSSFLSRIILERPYFQESVELGFALLSLIFTGRKDVKPHVDELLKEPSVATSLACALTCFVPQKDVPGIVRLNSRKGFIELDGFYYPENGSIDAEYFRWILETCGLKLRYIEALSDVSAETYLMTRIEASFGRKGGGPLP